MTAIDVWAQQPNPTFLAQPFFDSLKKWTGMEIDDIPLDFPELKIVGGHIGYPWTTEMIALATKFPNVYIDTSAYVPKRYAREVFKLN